MKKLGGFKYSWFIILLALTATGIIVGSFLDFQISQSIVDTRNFFSRFGESAYMGFGLLLIPLAFTVLLCSQWNKKNWLITTLLIIAVVAANGAMVYLFTKEWFRSEYILTKKTDTMILIVAGIGLVLSLATTLTTFFLFKNKDSKLLLKIFLAMVIIYAAQYIIQTIIKPIALRPRYRYIIREDSTVTFKNWWEFSFGSDLEVTDNIKSFPSGHTMTAATFLSLVPLSLCFENKKHLNLCLYCVAVFYIVTMGYLRVRAGAHFLSDVSFGAFIVTLVSFGTMKLMFHNQK